jgi:hypothetical protein
MQPVTSRDRRLLFGLAALTLAVAALTLVGVHSDVLLAIPTLLIAFALCTGRYVGEEQLHRLAAASPPASARRSPRALPRGGCLIAASLAVRPPPAAPRLTAS